MLRPLRWCFSFRVCAQLKSATTQQRLPDKSRVCWIQLLMSALLARSGWHKIWHEMPSVRSCVRVKFIKATGWDLVDWRARTDAQVLTHAVLCFTLVISSFWKKSGSSFNSFFLYHTSLLFNFTFFYLKKEMEVWHFTIQRVSCACSSSFSRILASFLLCSNRVLTQNPD